MVFEQLDPLYYNDWYALFVKTGSEKAIQNKLRYLGIDLLDFHVPCREIRIRKKGKWVQDLQPMFPGYVLVKGRISDGNYSKVQQLTDVYSWICDDDGPLSICPEEVMKLNMLIDADDVIRLTKVVFEGQRITVVDGPLMGQEAIIRKVDRRKGRVKIALSVFGNEKLVDISVEDVASKRNLETTAE